MGPTWGPPGSCRPQMGLMLAPWTLLSGVSRTRQHVEPTPLSPMVHIVSQPLNKQCSSEVGRSSIRRFLINLFTEITPYTLKNTAFRAKLYQLLTLLSTFYALIKESSVNKMLLIGVNKGVHLTPVFRVYMVAWRLHDILYKWEVQWNLSVTTTPIIKFITSDLFSNVFIMNTEGANLLLLTISAFWSSSRWPLST